MKSILKSIGIGILIGALSFFAFHLVITFLIIAGIMLFFTTRRLGRRGFAHQRFRKYRLAFADKIRNMNDEEYNSFRTNFENRGCRNRRTETNN